MKKVYVLSLFIFMCFGVALGHSGRTNSSGCHNESGGSYHCHNGGSSSSTSTSSYSYEPSYAEIESVKEQLIADKGCSEIYDVSVSQCYDIKDDSQLHTDQQIKEKSNNYESCGNLSYFQKDMEICFQSRSELEATELEANKSSFEEQQQYNQTASEMPVVLVVFELFKNQQKYKTQTEQAESYKKMITLFENMKDKVAEGKKSILDGLIILVKKEIQLLNPDNIDCTDTLTALACLVEDESCPEECIQ